MSGTPISPASQPVTLTPTSGGTLTDASGNKWTLTSAGVVDENGAAVPNGSDTAAFAIVGNVYYGQDATTQDWYTYSPASQSWTSSAAPVLTPTPTPTPPTPTPTPTTGTRDPSQTPFASTSVFNLPLGSGAQWTPNAQLANSSIYINVSDWNEPIYTGTASDPLVTVYNDGSAVGAAPVTYQVHIPADAVPSQPTPGDNNIAIDDTKTHTWYSFGNFSYTSATTAVATQGSAEPDYGSGIAFDNSNQDEGVGTLRESDLQAGTIDHMLRVMLPFDMLQADQTSGGLAAPAWPQTQEDGFAISGNGGPAYSGTVPYGITMGIPSTAVEPADVKANAGANMLWTAMQDHGAMVRDSDGGGPTTVTLQTDQNVNPSDPLIQGMEQYGSEIMAQVEILANQGPNSINGGGTPIVPLDPPPSDAPGGSATSATVGQSQISASATSVSPMQLLGSSGTSGASTSGATPGGEQTYVIPAAGNGVEAFTSNILAMGDTLNLTTALAATNWNGSASTLPNYLKVADSTKAATLSISARSSGSGVVIATIDGATTATLSSLLAHSIT
jgi:hypothetical protein